MSEDKEAKMVFVVCPACGYLVETRYPSNGRSDGSKECKNCGKNVGWSIYADSAFPYIKKDKQ